MVLEGVWAEYRQGFGVTLAEEEKAPTWLVLGFGLLAGGVLAWLITSSMYEEELWKTERLERLRRSKKMGGPRRR